MEANIKVTARNQWKSMTSNIPCLDSLTTTNAQQMLYYIRKVLFCTKTFCQKI